MVALSKNVTANSTSSPRKSKIKSSWPRPLSNRSHTQMKSMSVCLYLRQRCSRFPLLECGAVYVRPKQKYRAIWLGCLLCRVSCEMLLPLGLCHAASSSKDQRASSSSAQRTSVSICLIWPANHQSGNTVLMREMQLLSYCLDEPEIEIRAANLERNTKWDATLRRSTRRRPDASWVLKCNMQHDCVIPGDLW